MQNRLSAQKNGRTGGVNWNVPLVQIFSAVQFDQQRLENNKRFISSLTISSLVSSELKFAKDDADCVLRTVTLVDLQTHKATHVTYIHVTLL